MSHATTTVDRPRGDALIGAVAAAGYAPSILNTQPWRWRLEPGQLQLFAERSRRLTVTDPQGRQLMINCGAALHHARTALDAASWSAHVTRLPRHPPARSPRHTHGGRPARDDRGRGPPRTGHPRPAHRPAARQRPAAARRLPRRHRRRARAHSRLHIFTPDQALALASAAGRAAAVQADDPRVGAELAHWTGTAAPPGTGLPAAVLPEHPAQTTVPGRDFGRRGTLPIGTGHDNTAVYALLFGDADEPVHWLRTGEAPSSTASAPHLVLRLGVADPERPGSMHTSRRAAPPIADSSAE